MKSTVTPWEVKGNVNYDHLINEFGLQKIDDELLARIEKYAKAKGMELHHLLRRKIFFAHRDLKWLLDEYDKGNKFFLYTGRSPSGHIHLGHIFVWQFTKWLQDVFDVELWFQFPDEEKFLFKDNLNFQDIDHYLNENMLDVIALGFNSKKTHFLIDTMHAGIMYKQALRVAKKITFSTAKAAFGFKRETNIGAIFYTSMQAVPAFLPSFLANKNIPCLIPHAVDQDPHFRVSRDVITKLGYYKPSSIQCSFMPGLGGIETDGKMSSSQGSVAIYTVDDNQTVKRKINKYAFSGGKDTLEEHRKHGGDTSVDVSYNWLLFYEEDDKKLLQIKKDYESGKLLSGELKAILIEKINEMLNKHRIKRKKAKNKLKNYIYKI